jgi:F-type H+-transporting ATPase subunit a
MIIRKFSSNSNILATALMLLFFVFTAQISFAQEHQEHSIEAEAAHSPAAEEGFNAGEMIMGHVMDDHSWHIMDYTDAEGHEHPVAIPLPIIIYDKTSGQIHTFMSSKFEHGHASYDGFRLFSPTKIVRADDHSENGETASELMDFSITKTTFAVFITAFLMLLIFLSIAKSYTKRKNEAPKGLQSFMEPIIIFVRDDVAKPSIGKNYEKYMPFLLTVFFFILISNLMGLVPFFPGGSNVAGNIAVTMVLAIFTFIITTASTNKAYWVHIVNMPGVPWWLKFPIPIMPLVEVMGVFTKPFVLMVRLFANILAGHIVLLGFVSMIFIFGALSPVGGYAVSVFSVAFSIFLSLLEILVAFIQAYVFTLLSALYFGMAKVTDH